MSIFEFIMVMVSLILALALAQALRGATEFVTSPKRYLPHGSWLLLIILTILQTWWAYWDWNVISDWRFTTYLAALVFPMVLFIAVYLLTPATRARDIDWRSHFYAVRTWFFLTLMFLWVFGVFINVYVWDNSFLPILTIIILLASQLVVRMQIGALIRS